MYPSRTVRATMETWAALQGWTTDTQLTLALEYIGRFCNHDHFDRFLTKVAAGENKDDENTTIHVLVVDTDEGPVVWACQSEEAAWRELEEYVREHWPGDRPFPEDPTDAVEQYFQESLDTYSIEQVAVQP